MNTKPSKAVFRVDIGFIVGTSLCHRPHQNPHVESMFCWLTRNLLTVAHVEACCCQLQVPGTIPELPKALNWGIYFKS